MKSDIYFINIKNKNMKTKNLKLILKLIAIPSILVFTVLSVSADYGSYGNPPNSPEANCSRFHDSGYTGGTGAPGSDFPNGTPFATFNGYTDAETVDGRPFNERQFAYIELSHANGSGAFPKHNGVDYHPWQTQPIPKYNFNAPQATSYEFQFTNNAFDRYYVGVWGYMHNNGTADKYLAEDVKLKLTGFSEDTPQTTHRPKYTISADNTCPESVFADVEISGNREFTMDLNEFYVFREPPQGSQYPYQIVNINNNTSAQQNLTTTGLGINSRAELSGGKFESSEVHWVAVYAEFEVIPEKEEEPKECRNLQIITPDEADDGKANISDYPTITVDENGYSSEPLTIALDSDPGVVERIQFKANPTARGIQLSETPDGPQDGMIYIDGDETTVYMHGLPDYGEPGDTEYITVFALDDKDNLAEDSCADALKVKLEEEEEEPVCEVFNTDPGSAGSQQVDIGVTEIELEGPLDSNGDPYRPDNEIPNIRYCYSNEGVTFMPDSGNVVHPGDNLQCAVAPETDPMVVETTQTGTMDIEVVEDPDNCNDTFKTDFEYGGKCLLLEFVQDEFDIEEETEYCVTLDVEEAVEGYDDHIQWEIERNGDTIFSEDTTNTLCIDLEDYNYDFRPGDILSARALDIDYDNEDCEDELVSEELICEELDLDKNTFETGQDNEVCIEDIDPDNWPVNSTGVEASADGDDAVHLDVDNDCFVLEEDFVEDAEEIEVWIDGYEEECSAILRKFVRPPDFSKNVKDQDGAVFSTRAIANFSDSYVDYRIKYEHKNSDEDQDVVITDTIGVDGYIQGYIANPDDPDYEDRPEGGRIYYDEGSMEVNVEGEGGIDDCNDLDSIENEICYTGSIGSSGGVLIRNVPDRSEVEITYRGEIESKVNPENCSDPDHPLWETGVCGEFYPNVSEFEDDYPHYGRDNAEVVIPCPFFIIRSGGEVFMENPFDYGVDTLACSEIENVPSPFVVPDYEPPQETPSTGVPEGLDLIEAFDDRLCNTDKAQEVGYGGENRASSLICEVTLKTSDDLTQSAITQNIERNIQLFARYDRDLNNLPVVNGSDSLPESTSDVFVKDNGDLTLSGSFKDGAQTIVVLNNDVIIDGNITFDDPSQITDPRSVPSLAVIVIGGDIIVKDNVTETNGVFFIMENEEGQGGKMCEKSCEDDEALSRFNDNQFVHFGSIYGDIQHLFKYRTFAGDPSRLEAAVLIKFDSRIFLNTPPLLNKLINVRQQVF